MIAFMIQLSLVLSQSWDDILQFVVNLHNTGVSWGAVITSIILWGKMMRNKRYHERDIRMEGKLDALLQKEGIEWKSQSYLQQDSSKTVRIPYIKNYYIYLLKAIKHLNPRRNQTMLKILKSIISKKLLAFLVASAITVLNGKFGLTLNAEYIYGIIALAITYIAGQSHVDARKAISNAVNAVSTAVIESAATTDGSAITTITAPPMSYEQIQPYVKDVHDNINNIFALVQSGKYTESTQQAINAYMTLHDYFSKNEVPHAAEKSA